MAGALPLSATGCQAILGIKDPVLGAAGPDGAAGGPDARPGTADGGAGKLDGGAGKLDGGSASPSPRSGTAMVYDAACRCVVLFGGNSTAGALNDTWEWDGSRWRNVTPASGNPPPRWDHVMAYDAARQRVVLFGGYAEQPKPLGDTWEWDGQSWTEATPASSTPPARSFAAMAYDAAIGQVVLFGGQGFQGNLQIDLAGTWEWDGNSWTEVNDGSSGAPERRCGTALTYDADSQQVVMFGGNGASSGALNDTWAWDGQTWTDVTPASENPIPRDYEQLAYDEARQQVVLFGGSNSSGTTLDDTWRWDGTGWANVTPASGNPPAADDAAMAYDGVNQRALLVDTEGGMWEWDGSSWHAL